VHLRIGTCGWQYRHWRGVLYPPGLPASRWLEHYAARFAVVEVDSSFYRLPRPEVTAGWARRTPPGFEMAAKASRYLTHVRRLRDPAQPVGRMTAAFAPLGDRMGPLLVQLPPGLPADPPALAAVLDLLPPGLRAAVEPRHDSWSTPEVTALLRARGAALCVADRGGPPAVPAPTAPWGYVRFHGASWDAPYPSGALAAWCAALDSAYPGDTPVYAFFNNDGAGHAVRDAAVLAAAADALGIARTRIPV
jgi:uncharacterized protein YecE (DUF72 family)